VFISPPKNVITRVRPAVDVVQPLQSARFIGARLRHTALSAPSGESVVRLFGNTDQPSSSATGGPRKAGRQRALQVGSDAPATSRSRSRQREPRRRRQLDAPSERSQCKTPRLFPQRMQVRDASIRVVCLFSPAIVHGSRNVHQQSVDPSSFLSRHSFTSRIRERPRALRIPPASRTEGRARPRLVEPFRMSFANSRRIHQSQVSKHGHAAELPFLSSRSNVSFYPGARKAQLPGSEARACRRRASSSPPLIRIYGLAWPEQHVAQLTLESRLLPSW